MHTVVSVSMEYLETATAKLLTLKIGCSRHPQINRLDWREKAALRKWYGHTF